MKKIQSLSKFKNQELTAKTASSIVGGEGKWTGYVGQHGGMGFDYWEDTNGDGKPQDSEITYHGLSSDGKGKG